MTEPQPPTTEALVKLAGTSPARWRGIPREASQSYPVPIKVDGELRLAFLFYRKRVAPPADPIITVPRNLLQVTWAAGTIAAVMKLPEGFFKLPVPDDGVLGPYKLAPEITIPIWHDKRAALFALYDQLLPAYEQGVPLDDALQQQFWAAFEELVEQPLLPYYQALGRDFFNWIS
jgi:hypothetical protein